MTVGKKQSTDNRPSYAHADNTRYNVGSKPVVNKTYESGSNARGRNDAARRNYAEPKHDGGSSITQESAVPPKDK